eukprot:Protomagalhaensia_wolfi_Nauph_80__1748@NODE_208_length_3177_cov_155_269917_g156_i0_p2_GENE_NODE_208_length_3177_cov_155_269917_g156_i0NODE_208_length_3177_cov_155_269917_g156_i0_p2_ORF_typecomplete_len436_score51_36_NODE_208_length_3177_cov_155_269917_g156_i01421449
MVASQQDNLELSVVAHDLRLDSSCGQDLIESVNRYAVRTTPVKFTPPQTAKRSANPRNKVNLDDPDDLLQLTRAEELRKKRYWVLPLVSLALMLSKLGCPFRKLKRAQADYKSFLAPTNVFYYLLIPTFIAEVIFTCACLAPLLRGSSIVHKGVSAGYAFSQIFMIAWFWTFTNNSSSLSTSFSLAFMSWACAMATVVSVRAERKESLSRVWQFRTRMKLNIRDFWLVEMPLTVYLMWTTGTLLITGNYFNAYDWLRYHPDGLYSAELTEVMIASALLTLMLFALVVTAFFCYTRRGSPIAAAMAVWILYDVGRNFGTSPDVLSSPQLAWVDAKVIGAAFKTGCFTLAFIFGTAALISISIHSLKFLSKSHALQEESGFSFISRSLPLYPESEWDRRSRNTSEPTTTLTVKRRPSEFLIRSLSSLTESNTPICKK